MTDVNGFSDFATVGAVIRRRHSERTEVDPGRRPSESDLRAMREGAPWAPTAHNMHIFEIIIVDDEATLAAIRRVRSATSREFIRENYAQPSFGEEELIEKGTGFLATMFPPSWHRPDGQPEEVLRQSQRFTRQNAFVNHGDATRISGPL